MNCPKCSNVITSYPCPNCGYIPPKKHVNIIIVLLCILIVFVVLSIGAILVNDLKNRMNLGKAINNINLRTYNIGDSVILINDTKWHVIKVYNNTLTLLSDTIIKQEQFSKHDYLNDYLESDVANYLNNVYPEEYFSGYSVRARLLTLDELYQLTPYEWNKDSTINYKTEDIKPGTQNFNILALTEDFYLQDLLQDPKNGGVYIVHFIKEEDNTIMRIETSKYNKTYGIRPVIEVDNSLVKN